MHGFLRNLMVVYTSVAIFACYILPLYKICWHFDSLLVWFLSISVYRIISYCLYASSLLWLFLPDELLWLKLLVFCCLRVMGVVICSWCHRKGFVSCYASFSTCWLLFVLCSSKILRCNLLDLNLHGFLLKAYESSSYNYVC